MQFVIQKVPENLKLTYFFFLPSSFTSCIFPSKRSWDSGYKLSPSTQVGRIEIISAPCQKRCTEEVMTYIKYLEVIIVINVGVQINVDININIIINVYNSAH